MSVAQYSYYSLPIVKILIYRPTLLLLLLLSSPLNAGEYERTITVDGSRRDYRIFLPSRYNPSTPLPVVLVFHPTGMSSATAVKFSGFSQEAECRGFIAVYPNSAGLGGSRSFNAGGLSGHLQRNATDDVKYIDHLLSDLSAWVQIDTRRLYATGFSNGGMMCYRLALEMPHRFAAIAPISGTMAIRGVCEASPIPILHIHGTKDRIVPISGPNSLTPRNLDFMSVNETLQFWRSINQSSTIPEVGWLPDTTRDRMRILQRVYLSEATGAEIRYIEIQGGGHWWPGDRTLLGRLSKSTRDIDGPQFIWEFLRRFSLD